MRETVIYYMAGNPHVSQASLPHNMTPWGCIDPPCRCWFASTPPAQPACHHHQQPPPKPTIRRRRYQRITATATSRATLRQGRRNSMSPLPDKGIASRIPPLTKDSILLASFTSRRLFFRISNPFMDALDLP